MSLTLPDSQVQANNVFRKSQRAHFTQEGHCTVIIGMLDDDDLGFYDAWTLWSLAPNWDASQRTFCCWRVPEGACQLPTFSLITHLGLEATKQL